MTPKQKAELLIDRYERITLPLSNFLSTDVNEKCDYAKKCALICVDEILDLDTGDTVDEDYWQEVKQEIEKL